MDAPEADNLAQLARRDHLPREHQQRVLQIVVPGVGLDPARLGRLHHRPRVLGAGRDRLLAVDVLAGGDRGQRHLPVHEIGGGDGDDLDGGIGDEGPPIGGCALEAELALCPLRGFAVVVGDDFQHRPARYGKDPGDGAIGQRMGLAHEARADDAHPDVAHR